MGLSPRISAQIHEYLADISARRSLSISSEESTLLYRPTLPNEIRVFELSPGVGSDPLQGRLRHIDIGFKRNMNQAPLDQTSKRGYTTHIPINFSVETSERVPYTALSYYWGDAGPAHEVLVEGHPVKITSTVDQMLRHLRQVHRPITLWLDQLCIDQESNADKSIQVRLMGSIYSKAENTIIWLGERSDQGAFLGLQVLSQSLFAAKDFLLDEDLERLQRESFGEGVTFDMVEELFERPWVRRTWVVQEAVLSRDPYFMAGQEIVAWGDFAGYCVSLKEMDLFRRYDGNGQIGAISGAEILADMFSMRQTLETSKTDGLHFLSWLTNTRHASVTNPLDKIYGLLGVCPIAIHPDYTKSKEILYHETLTMLIRKDFKQDPRDAHRLIRSLLSCVDHETDARVVPSWVADWSKPRRTFALAPNLSIHPFFRAGTQVRWDEIALSADGRVITTSARFLGVVCQVSASLHPAELHYEDPQGRNSSLQTCVNFINTVLMTSAHGLQFENFCATIVAGKVASIVSPAPYPPEFIEIISLLCDATTGRSPSMPNQIYTKRQKSGHFTANNLARRQPGRTFQHLRRAYRNAVQGRRLCWIQTGHLGLVPQHTMVGDLVAVLPGCSVPFVFRKEGPDRYSLVGECYVHDVMDGKFMETATGPLEEIAIV
ncbi:HET-domain-containing protein [Dissoconium aciculare CBS 342.82]|uniref:HET-domain-containing protein n=1 Tax=Dissoconium aciculare CBS 342.82 TaxID=1314786 RepID=A0A6J3LRD3_9PEZI|nr:HET-domain-containing protein [Dissoconium aciculare CBS 342.82]KAF1818395.1 HET-domain-containing protein [Dissoconium aciculare CBS 342.82]